MTNAAVGARVAREQHRRQRCWLYQLSLVLLVSGCGSDYCLQAIVPSVSATVLDLATSENLSAKASGTLRQGDRTEPFIQDGDVLVAGRNWSGVFELEITAPGYRPHASSIVVPSYSCTVRTQTPVIRLVPESDG
jgi:hypothetical protein